MTARRAWLEASERLALRFENESLSARALDGRANALAGWLAAHGIAAGDVIAAHLPNGVDFAALVHAADRLDAILLPLNRRHTELELRDTCEDAGAKLVLHAGDASAETVVRGAGAARCSAIPKLPATGKGFAPARDADAAALLLYTSGTTGRAKGVVLTHRNLRASVAASGLHLGEKPDDHWLVCLPLFHIGGLSILLRCAAQGVPATVHPEFDAEAVAACLGHEPITHVSLVPTMLARMLGERPGARGPERAPERLRIALLGGAGAAPRLLEEAQAAGWPIAATYGLTEAASQVATRLPGAAVDAPLPPLPGVALRVVDDAGKPCPPGEVGEILVRGESVTVGYWNAPQASAAALRDGWLHTGDLGMLDLHGHLTPVDRRSDLIVSGGENIYPAEVEAVLCEHPDVEAVGVAGMPDAEYGQRPMAFVVARDGAMPDEKALREFGRERLAAFKLPVRITWVATLPTTAAGKLQRHRLLDSLTPEKP